MTITELMELVVAADKRQKGCSTEFTTINTPESSRGQMYGIVRYGWNQARTFHDEVELHDILERIAK